MEDNPNPIKELRIGPLVIGYRKREQPIVPLDASPITRAIRAAAEADYARLQRLWRRLRSLIDKL